VDQVGDVTERAPRAQLHRPTAPAKRWRNRWRHTKKVVFESGFSAGPSEHLGPSVFPSREVAEQRAADWLRDHPDMVTLCGVIYLGATPDPGGG
jgi:hypothetical protein